MLKVMILILKVVKQQETVLVLHRSNMEKMLCFICTFIISWQAIFKIPDSAITMLLKFLKVMLSKLADITNSQMLRQLHDVFPTGLAQAHKLQSINCDKFTRYVVCQLCHSTYSYDTVINTSDTEILKCSFLSVFHGMSKEE